MSWYHWECVLQLPVTLICFLALLYKYFPMIVCRVKMNLFPPLARSLVLAIGSCRSREQCLFPFAKLSRALAGNCRLPRPLRLVWVENLIGIDWIRIRIKGNNHLKIFCSPDQRHWVARWGESVEYPATEKKRLSGKCRKFKRCLEMALL